MPKINRFVCDIDGVVCNFVQGMLDYCHKYHIFPMPANWRDVREWSFFPPEVWSEICQDEKFWLTLPPFPNMAEEFDRRDLAPDIWLTARSISGLTSQEWLELEGFDAQFVVTVDSPLDKINFLKPGDLFVDDHIETVREASKLEGVTALLWSAPYHVSCDVSGLRVVSTVAEIAAVRDEVNQTRSSEIKVGQTDSNEIKLYQMPELVRAF